MTMTEERGERFSRPEHPQAVMTSMRYRAQDVVRGKTLPRSPIGLSPTTHFARNLALGRAVRVHRIMQGRTQNDLADAIGLSHTTMSHLETGKSEMTNWRLNALADALGVTPHDLATTAGLSDSMIPKPPPAHNIGAVMKHHREKMGLSQAQLGRLLTPPVSQNMISYVERGGGYGALANKRLCELATIFGIPTEALGIHLCPTCGQQVKTEAHHGRVP